MKRRYINLMLVGYFLFFAAVVIAYTLWQKSNQPLPQPIAFKHSVHINKVGLECTHCHKYADKGKTPGIPDMSICMKCHKNVKTDSPEIKKLTKYFNDKQLVPWTKIYNLADFVYFSHKRHIKKGKQCKECHGDVAGADNMRQVRSLTMGWCVSCHNKNGASIDCVTCHK